MTYKCPFCKQKMLHQPSNGSQTTDDSLIVKDGDTFKCGCSLKFGNINLNSWKYDKASWLMLIPDKEDWHGNKFVNAKKMPTFKTPLRRFVFR